MYLKTIYYSKCENYSSLTHIQNPIFIQRINKGYTQTFESPQGDFKGQFYKINLSEMPAFNNCDTDETMILFIY
jgi:hypothetical protein